MSDNLNQTPEEALGTEFWAQPEDVLSPEYGLIYAQVISILRREHDARGGSAVDLLLIERMAFMYSYLRMREAFTEDAMTDRTRREMNKDWIDLAANMRKMWSAEDKDSTADKILQKVDKAVQVALKDLAADEGRKVQKALAEAFENSGL